MDKNQQDNQPEKIIKLLLEEKIKPAWQSHGGDVDFIDFENGCVNVKLLGACDGCPHAKETVKNSIESILKYFVPEVKEVKEVSTLEE